MKHRMAGRRQHDAFELRAPRNDELAVLDRHPRLVGRDPELHYLRYRRLDEARGKPSCAAGVLRPA